MAAQDCKRVVSSSFFHRGGSLGSKAFLFSSRFVVPPYTAAPIYHSQYLVVGMCSMMDHMYSVGAVILATVVRVAMTVQDKECR